MTSLWAVSVFEHQLPNSSLVLSLVPVPDFFGSFAFGFLPLFRPLVAVVLLMVLVVLVLVLLLATLLLDTVFASAFAEGALLAFGLAALVLFVGCITETVWLLVIFVLLFGSVPLPFDCTADLSAAAIGFGALSSQKMPLLVLTLAVVFSPQNMDQFEGFHLSSFLPACCLICT